MTITLELDDAQARLSEIIANLRPGEEILLVQNGQSMARIVPEKRAAPSFGSCRGLLSMVHEDDEHLKDFQEYMP